MFSGSHCTLFIEVATKNYFRDKKLWKYKFLSCCYKAKPEECNQKSWITFGQFGIIVPCSATYFLELSAHVLLEAATKGSCRGKKL